jgi:hypothetical protein
VQLAVPLDVSGCLPDGFEVDGTAIARMANGTLAKHQRNAGHVLAVLRPAISECLHGREEFRTVVIAHEYHGVVVNRRSHADGLSHGKETLVDDVFHGTFSFGVRSSVALVANEAGVVSDSRHCGSMARRVCIHGKPPQWADIFVVGAVFVNETSDGYSSRRPATPSRTAFIRHPASTSADAFRAL